MVIGLITEITLEKLYKKTDKTLMPLFSTAVTFLSLKLIQSIM